VPRPVQQFDLSRLIGSTCGLRTSIDRRSTGFDASSSRCCVTSSIAIARSSRSRIGPADEGRGQAGGVLAAMRPSAFQDHLDQLIAERKCVHSRYMSAICGGRRARQRLQCIFHPSQAPSIRRVCVTRTAMDRSQALDAVLSAGDFAPDGWDKPCSSPPTRFRRGAVEAPTNRGD
jgi:hypothetical protein